MQLMEFRNKLKQCNVYLELSCKNPDKKTFFFGSVLIFIKNTVLYTLAFDIQSYLLKRN